jgi:hypothetical protein
MASARVKYIDDEAGGIEVDAAPGTETHFLGMPGEAIGFTETMARAGVPSGYVWSSFTNVATFDGDSSTDQIIEVHVRHEHDTSKSLDVTRTITYTGGPSALPNVVQTRTWNIDSDLATRVDTYSTTQSYPAVTSPPVPGFTPDISQVESVPAGTTTIKPTNSTVTVTYSGSALQVANVVFVDDDKGGETVTPTSDVFSTLYGQSGEEILFMEDMAESVIPPNYTFKGIDAPEEFDYDFEVDQTVTVHLGHSHSSGGEKTVSRTIEYRGAGSATPANVVQEVEWTVDTDLVTNVVTYSATSGYAKVVSPVLPGYTVDKADVPATSAVGSTTVEPMDSTVTVTYTPIP